MNKNDNIIDSHEFKIPIYFDHIKNKSIWCFAKEYDNDEDVFYIYHDIKDQSEYTRISMNSAMYVYDENMKYLSIDDIEWMIKILLSPCIEVKDKNVWEYMIISYSFESAAYNGIILPQNKPMPDYTKLREGGILL